jgi:hypothetical protein
MNRLTQLKTTIPPHLVTLVFICFALSPTVQAVTPAPDGGYPGFNTAEGQSALGSATPGVWNTAIGGFALNSAITGGTGNTAVGLNALRANTLGDFNSALGVNALRFNVTGINNTAVGYQALFVNTGDSNTAVGVNALSHNTTGVQNAAVGQGALGFNTLGVSNTATGFQALFSNNTGYWNTATGSGALFRNTVGIENTADGLQALYKNIYGRQNTAIGFQALYSASTESLGQVSITASQNTAVGCQALYQNFTGSANIAVGNLAGYNITGTYNIDIGNVGVDMEDSTIRIGSSANQNRTFIAGIRGRTTGVANAVPVLIDSNGQLGTASSSRRFKKEIKPMDQSSEAILGLKPVTFHYKSDTTGTPQFGLIAEEVAEVNPDLVVRDGDGEIYTVRYEAVNAMLLNEFLKEHRKVEEQSRKIQEQETTITQLKQDFQSKLAEQQKQIKALTTGLEKVNNQLELIKPAPQIVVNDQ